MVVAEKVVDIGGTGGAITKGMRTLREPKSMNDIDLMRRLDIEDIEKHIGDKILSECFVLETMPLVKDLSQKFVKLLESSKTDSITLVELIEASGKLQRSQQLCEFEHASLLLACEAHHQIIKPLSEV